MKTTNGKKRYRIAIVVSKFNSSVTEKLCASALERLNERGFTSEYLTIIKVPGAVEIPLAAQRLATTDLYEAVICLGAVIQGETDHYEYVCHQVSQGCQRVALDYDIPVVFGVLTTQNETQALERIYKGKEAVDVAIEMVEVLREIGEL